jgi:hypothetical protein
VRASANAPQIAGRHRKLLALTGGKDWTVLPGLSDDTLLRLIGEVGPAMSRWKSAAHFTSWLCLTPRKAQSGQRTRRARRRPKTRAAQTLRVAARAVGQSKYLALGGFYRRIRGRASAATATVATARKRGVLFYNFLRHGRDYVEQGLAHDEEQFKERTVQRLNHTAKKTRLRPPPDPEHLSMSSLAAEQHGGSGVEAGGALRSRRIPWIHQRRRS